MKSWPSASFIRTAYALTLSLHQWSTLSKADQARCPLFTISFFYLLQVVFHSSFFFFLVCHFPFLAPSLFHPNLVLDLILPNLPLIPYFIKQKRFQPISHIFLIFQKSTSIGQYLTFRQHFKNQLGSAGMVGILNNTKHRDIVYYFIYQNNRYRPYRPILHGILKLWSIHDYIQFE